MKVSAIVPGFNEEKTISKVVDCLLKSPEIKEVIAINDGSTDKTLTILKRFKSQIKLIDLKKNQGKGYALTAGINQAKNEVLMFMDADLVNLKQRVIK